ncbi:nucleotide exchange factor GrpE [Leptolyngbya sp. BL0902]|uniref:nucleotide exchange factor GrpE n=1 Tax=Leptolyngbya sp. BL0902 TaxID=1115757 RepID=UPI0018E75277|nr:nucleotide exchange factor GrpE [Leptolyngbya sp. BL0902]QQE65413.1 nucleotide exchange factor GrpE [Leptolyngbya sp. BL0902]
MVDEQHQADIPEAAPATEGVEELHEEDAALDIDIDQALDGLEAELAEEPGVRSASGVEVAHFEQQIADLKAQIEDQSNQAIRIAADFENYRKRTAREKEDLENQVKGNTVIELLPVVDNFERARSQIKPQTEAEMAIHKSYQSVYKQLVETLKRLGVSALRAEGQEFDPQLHEAVMREPTADHPEGTVIEEFVRGYQLGDRVLRYAMVKVAAPPEADSPASEES